MYTKLRNLRKRSTIKVSDIINKLGLKTVSAYYKKEVGLIPFSLNEAKELSLIFQVTIDDLFFN